MKLLDTLFQRQIGRPYTEKKLNVDFVIKGMKCHKDDEHNVRGLDTETEVPPFACSFNKSLLHGRMLAVADEEGGVCLYDVRRQGPSAKLKGWMAHSNAVFDIAWVCNEPKLVTASGDQTAQLWDIQHGTRLAVFKGHSCSLKSVDFQDGNLFVFATGARDGNVMVWDMRCNKRDGYYKPVNTIHNCHSTTTTTGTPKRTGRRGRRLSSVVTPDSQQSVTSVIFQDPNTIISAGAVDGKIKVWDIRKNYSTIRTEPQPYHVFPYPGSGTRKHGYSSLTLDSTKSKLFANCTNDVIYMYDCVTYPMNPSATFRGHSNATFYIKSCVSPDDQYLMSGSGDCDGYIWRIDDPTAAPFHLIGHANEVTCVAWCPKDQTKVVTCSDENSFKVWRVDYTEKNKGDFVGWCERKPISPSDDLPKTTTPHTSPARSRSNSTASSPVSLSPNPTNCRSPQQFLESWLKSSDKTNSVGRNSPANSTSLGNTDGESSNKRQRETEDTVNTNKRVCLDSKVEENNEDNTSVQCGTSHEKELSKDTNKENVDINMNFQLNSGQSPANLKSERQSNTNSEESSSCSKLSPQSVTNQSDCTKDGTNQSECKNAVMKPTGKKSNWLRDMGVKKKSLNKMPRKVKPPSQPSSPRLQETPSSPNTNLRLILKNTRSIRDYFVPASSHKDSPSESSFR